MAENLSSIVLAIPAAASEQPSAALVVVGAGWYALEIAEYAEDAGWSVLGLVELLDADRVGSTHGGRKVVAMADITPGMGAVVAGPGDRRAAWAGAVARGATPVVVQHPTAHVSAASRLASGAVIGPLAVIGTGASIGPHVIVSRGGLVGHHAQVGAYSLLFPGSNIAGHVRIGEEVAVGMNAAIAHHVKVGDGATVGAAAMVLRDVPADTRVQGVPARPFVTG
jgi:sugar O-acyltransferase (sialic acid O-acetyltransferase NeuD family)